MGLFGRVFGIDKAAKAVTGANLQMRVGFDKICHTANVGIDKICSTANEVTRRFIEEGIAVGEQAGKELIAEFHQILLSDDLHEKIKESVCRTFRESLTELHASVEKPAVKAYMKGMIQEICGSSGNNLKKVVSSLLTSQELRYMVYFALEHGSEQLQAAILNIVSSEEVKNAIDYTILKGGDQLEKLTLACIEHGSDNLRSVVLNLLESQEVEKLIQYAIGSTGNQFEKLIVACVNQGSDQLQKSVFSIIDSRKTRDLLDYSILKGGDQFEKLSVACITYGSEQLKTTVLEVLSSEQSRTLIEYFEKRFTQSALNISNATIDRMESILINLTRYIDNRYCAITENINKLLKSAIENGVPNWPGFNKNYPQNLDKYATKLCEVIFVEFEQHTNINQHLLKANEAKLSHIIWRLIRDELQSKFEYRVCFKDLGVQRRLAFCIVRNLTNALPLTFDQSQNKRFYFDNKQMLVSYTPIIDWEVDPALIESCILSGLKEAYYQVSISLVGDQGLDDFHIYNERWFKAYALLNHYSSMNKAFNQLIQAEQSKRILAINQTIWIKSPHDNRIISCSEITDRHEKSSYLIASWESKSGHVVRVAYRPTITPAPLKNATFIRGGVDLEYIDNHLESCLFSNMQTKTEILAEAAAKLTHPDEAMIKSWPEKVVDSRLANKPFAVSLHAGHMHNVKAHFLIFWTLQPYLKAHKVKAAKGDYSSVLNLIFNPADASLRLSYPKREVCNYLQLVGNDLRIKKSMIEEKDPIEPRDAPLFSI